MKSLVRALFWLLCSTGVLFTAVIGIMFYDMHSRAGQAVSAYFSKSESASIAEYIPPEESVQVLGSTTAMQTDDARALLVTNFLKRYNTGNRKLNHPLVPEEYYGQFFVELADKHEIDFRLIPAIAMQESNLCKVTPKVRGANGEILESYNCLGFGVHSRGTLTFPNFEANFERAARELKAYYIDQGRTTPEQIMKKYTPSSPGTWAASVNQWMTEMRYDDRTSGIILKENADLLEFVSSSEAEVVE